MAGERSRYHETRQGDQPHRDRRPFDRRPAAVLRGDPRRRVYEGIEEVADQKVRVGFFRVGDVRLELLEPTDPSSTIAAFLDKKGEGLHHVAYTVEDIESRIAELKQGGVRMIDETPRPGAHHTRIAFVHPKSSCGVLTELCEPVAGHGTAEG